MKKKISLILCLILLPVLAFAQYSGGSYDGYAMGETPEGGTTLPVELSAFTATYVAEYDYISICWTTASEADVLGFNIHRSKENDFTTTEKINLDIIDGHETTSETHNYTYHDETIIEENIQAGDTYWYWLEVVELGGYSNIEEPCKLIIPDDYEPPVPPDLPIIYGLYQNCPNPFNPSAASITKVFFSLHKGAEVEINVYNIRGEFVRCIYSGYAEFDDSNPRPKVAYWNGRSDNGIEQPTGIYLYQLKVNGKLDTIKRLLLIR